MTDNQAAMFRPGTMFHDRYEILSVLGRGGFGEVYRARQLSTGQDVAIKVIRPSFGTSTSGDDNRNARFLREMKLCAQLHHPNVVRLVDSGQTPEGQLFSVFDYVPGKDLRTVLDEEGKLDPAEVVRLMGQVLDALAAAHNQGVVHRDLKPANIMVTTTGVRRNATVLDFGIGAFVKRVTDEDLQKITGTGQMIGTPAYSPPEQLMGVQPTTRSDLYSWGLVFLECLTGEAVFKGATLPQVVFQQIDPKPVPLPPILRNHPLGALLGRVLVKEVTKRQVTAIEVLGELEGIDLSGLVEGEFVYEPSDEVQTLDERRLLQAARELAATQAHSSAPAAAEAAHIPAEGERRQLTALGCSMSVVGSETEDIDLEAYDATLSWLEQQCHEVARKHEGYVANLVSDRALIYFGYPTARENDPHRAARAALDLVDRVRERNERAAKGDALPEIRIGIHTGLVIARASLDSSRSGSLEVVGPTTNVASQLSTQADPDTILASADTCDLLGDDFEQTAAASYRVRGRSQPVDACQIKRVTGKRRLLTALFPDDAAPMVGRQQELALLRNRWHQSHDGKGGAILISGEPGIGKSRLARELIKEVANGSGTWIEGHCAAESQQSPLQPVADLVERAIGLDRVSDDQEKLRLLDEFLAGLGFEPSGTTPLLGTLLSLPMELSDVDTPDISPQKRKELTFDAVMSLLFELAQEQPLLIVIEDLHWADPTTLELLELLIGEADGAPMCLALTARPEFKPTWPATKVSQIALGRLGQEQVEEMVLGLTAGRPVPPEVVEAVAQRTDGVSLFVEELVEMLLRTGLLIKENDRYVLSGELSDLTIPSSLRDLLTSRLDRLGPAKQTAQLASALGREFSGELLEAVSERTHEAFESDIRTLIDADLLHRQRRLHQKQYAFKHALIRDTAYESLLGATRRGFHARIAQTLEERFGDMAAKRPDLLAYHHAGAEQYPQALSYAQKAGMAALGRSANQEALQQAKTALRWLEAIPDPVRRASFELGLNGVMSPALMAISGFAAPELSSLSERSLELLDIVGEGPLTFPTLFGVTTYHHIHNDREQARTLAERTLEVAERSGDEGLTCAALCQLAHCSWIESEFQTSRELFEKAISLYDVEAHKQLAPQFGYDMLSWAKMTVAMVYWSQGYPDRALTLTLEAAEHARQIKHANSLGLSLLYVAMVHHFDGDREATGQTTDELDEACKKYGMFYNMSYGGSLGCWAKGEVDLARQIIAGMRASGALLALSYYPSLLAETLFDKGEVDDALEILEGCIVHGTESGETYYLPCLYRLKGEWLLHRGERDQGIVNLMDAFERSQTLGLRLHALQAAMSLFRHQGHTEEGPQARERLIRSCDAFDADPVPALVTEARALLARTPA